MNDISLIRQGDSKVFLIFTFTYLHGTMSTTELKNIDYMLNYRLKSKVN